MIRMKKAIFSLVATATLLASCDTTPKDSYSNVPYQVYNLIVDTQDMEQPAIVSSSSYMLNTNLSKGVVDITVSDIVINNNKYSFETDTMALGVTKFKPLDGQDIYTQTFSKRGPAAVGSAASDIKGSYAYHYLRSASEQSYYPVSIDNPQYYLAVLSGLDLNYKLSDRYLVQTFYSESLFLGNSYVNDESGNFSTKKGDYLLGIDFQKNLATLYIYNPEYSINQAVDFPKIIRVDKIPVKYSHDRFNLEASSPSTTVLSTKNNKSEFVDNPSIQVSDFTLNFISPDVTEAEISYKIAGKTVSFNGCSILKGGR